jgi:hypothetical protein
MDKTALAITLLIAAVAALWAFIEMYYGGGVLRRG